MTRRHFILVAVLTPSGCAGKVPGPPPELDPSRAEAAELDYDAPPNPLDGPIVAPPATAPVMPHSEHSGHEGMDMSATPRGGPR